MFEKHKMHIAKETRKKEIFEDCLESLDWTHRKALHFIWAASDETGLLMYTETKSVPKLISHAIQEPQSIVYDCITRLEEFGLVEKVSPDRPDWMPRDRGVCLQLKHAKDSYDHIALAILRFPPDAKYWLLYDPVYRARDWVRPMPKTW